ncbi:MAG: exosortase/archaeosortase family protein [Methanomicrobia archaeon]|nr:exosortase/archaeosortase family protein [Methanomicrobia archaeon]
MKLPKGALAIALLVALLYFRTFHWLVNTWLTDPYYSHGFLIVLVSCFIAWRALHTANSQNDPKPEPYTRGLFVFAFGLILYVIGFVTIFPLLTALSFLFVTSGLILYLYGKPLMRAFLFPVAFLIFAIPLPLVFLNIVAHTMQTVAARYPTALLELLGIPVTRVGAEIHLTDASFTVGLPCSGMYSLISLLALATLFIYLLNCPLYKKAALLCLAVPIAILANVIRVTSLLLIANAYGAETASGFYHTLFSPLLFILAFICLILISILMRCSIAGR